MNGTSEQINQPAAAPQTQATLPPSPQPAPKPDPRTKSQVLASVLSIMPGLGQIYVGHYPRGFFNIVVAAGIITLLASDVGSMAPLLGIFLGFFWLYNIIDAGRRAAFYNEMLAGGATIDLPADFKMPGVRGTIMGGVMLITAGVILLLHTRFEFRLDWIEEWWPVAAIILGIYLVVKAVQERRE